MTRNLKALGMALVSALALGAIAASAAHGNEEGHFIGAETEGPHVTTFVTGEDHENLEFTAGETVVTCKKDEFHAGIAGGTAKTLTIVPTLGGSGTGVGDRYCTASNLPATIDENGCHFEIYTLETEPSDTHTWQATTRLNCPTGAPGIQWTVFASANHSILNRVCMVTFPPQEGLTGVTVHNRTEGEHNHLTISLDVSNITKTRQGLCGHEHGFSETHGAVTMQGTDELGSPVDLYVAHTEE